MKSTQVNYIRITHLITSLSKFHLDQKLLSISELLVAYLSPVGRINSVRVNLLVLYISFLQEIFSLSLSMYLSANFSCVFLVQQSRVV